MSSIEGRHLIFTNEYTLTVGDGGRYPSSHSSLGRFDALARNYVVAGYLIASWFRKQFVNAEKTVKAKASPR